MHLKPYTQYKALGDLQDTTIIYCISRELHIDDMKNKNTPVPLYHL
jgi:hypothetical protein